MSKSELPILVVDVGGTKTVIALATFGDSTTAQLAFVQTFSSRQTPSLNNLLDQYLATISIRPSHAVIAVAGPVLDGRASVTNLSWTVDASAIRDAYGFERVILMNDLEAMAWSIPRVSPDDIKVLQDGQGLRGGPIALLAPGTGLGVAFLTWNGATYDVHATEAGHADFAPSNDEQTRLLAYLRDKFGHVSVERVC